MVVHSLDGGQLLGHLLPMFPFPTVSIQSFPFDSFSFESVSPFFFLPLLFLPFSLSLLRLSSLPMLAFSLGSKFSFAGQ